MATVAVITLMAFGPAMFFVWVKLVLRGTSFWSFFWFHLLTVGGAIAIANAGRLIDLQVPVSDAALTGAWLATFSLLAAGISERWSKRAQG